MSELESKIAELERKIEQLEQSNSTEIEDGTAIVIFSGDMDRVIAALNIAVGNLSLGKDVSIFFTFWGVPLLKKQGPQSSSKHFLQKMFGWMLPTGVKNLPLSRMNFLGMGPLMMKYLMKKYDFADIEQLFETAVSLGAKTYICSMSMDLMGIKKEELLSEPELVYTGVPGFMQIADSSRLTLFI